MADSRIVREVVIKGRTEGLDQVTAGLDKVRTAQDQLGVSAVKMLQASDDATRSQLNAARAFDRLQASISPAFQASQKFSAGQAAADRALNLGVVSAQQHASAIDGLRTKYVGLTQANENHTSSLGSNRTAMLELGHVAKASFESLASGAPILTVLTQQGASAAQAISLSNGGLGASFKEAASGAVGLVTRISPAIATFGVLGATVTTAALAYARFSSNQRDLAMGLAGAGRASGATPSSVNQIADANATGGLSAQSIRELSVEFARTGKVGADMFGDLSRFTHDYAKLTGQDLADAGKDVASAFASQAAGALKLNETIGGLSGETYQLIQRFESMGDRAGAQRVMMDAFGASLKAAAENTGLLSKAWEHIKSDFSEGADEIGRAVSMAVQGGPDLATQFATAQKILESSRSRSWLPIIGQRDVATAQADVDRLQQKLEAERKRTEEGVTGAKTLAGAEALQKLSPTYSDLQALQTYASQLKAAFDTGKGVTGTEQALARVNELLKAGGQAAYDLKRAAQEAFDTAGLLPFQKSLASINAEFAERLKAPGLDDRARASIEAARNLQLGAARIGAVDVPLRDANRTIDEQSSSLKVQRDSLFLSTDAAAAMAAKQELVNQYARQGIDILKENAAGLESYAQKAGAAAKAAEDFSKVKQNVVGGLDELRSGTSGLITGIASDLRQRKNPLDGIVNSIGRMADQGIDRFISKPLTESLFGQMGKAGGGLFGDSIGKAIGAISTPSAIVNAGTVTINGLTTGGSAGLPGITSTTAQGSSSVLSQGASVVQQSTTTAVSAAGTAGRVSVQLGSGSQAGGALPVTQASLPSPSNVIPFTRPSISPPAPSGPYQEGYNPTTAQQSLVTTLPMKPVSGLTYDPADIRARDLDRAGGFSGNPPSDAVFDRMFGPMRAKASEMAQASGEAAASVNKLGGSSDLAAGALSKIGDRLGGGSGSGGSNFGINGWPKAGGGAGGSDGFDTGGSEFDFGAGGGLDVSGFATGGIMTSRGRLPLNRYAKGGIANSPQMALFGEGRSPEAYVPLPDGRSIPVSMRTPYPVASNENAPAAPVTIHHAPTYNVMPAEGVTPAQLKAVMEQNNKDFVRSLPGHLSEIQKRRA